MWLQKKIDPKNQVRMNEICFFGKKFCLGFSSKCSGAKSVSSGTNFVEASVPNVQVKELYFFCNKLLLIPKL